MALIEREAARKWLQETAVGSETIDECSALVYRTASNVLTEIPTIVPIRAADGWISVKGRLPEEHDSGFASYFGTPLWRDGMIKKQSDDVWVVVEVEDVGRFISITITIDGVWFSLDDPRMHVTHWMPLPEPPKEAAHD